jgi:dipeptidyl-peptidase 4
MKRWTRLVTVALVGALLPGALEAQARGMALFGAMVGGNLAPITGTTAVRWLPDGMGYLERDSTAAGWSYFKVDPPTGRRSPLFDARTTKALLSELERLGRPKTAALPFGDFSYEQAGRSIRFTLDGGQYLFDLGARALRRLRMPSQVGPLDQATTEAGTFSPDFRWYAFIRDYDNLFLCDTETGREERLTTGTSENNLVGFLDAGPWYVWSPDGKRVAYLTADQSEIYRYPLLHNLEPKATVELFRYPLTISPNPTLTLHVIDVATKVDRVILTTTQEKPYLRDIVWLDDGSEVTFQVVGQWMNHRELRAVDPESGRMRTILVDSLDTYFDPEDGFRQLSDGRRLTWSSERSGWKQLYLYDRSGREIRQLTTGEWDKGPIAGIDERGGWIYFTGATRLGLEQHLFRIKLDGTGLEQLTPEPGMHFTSMDPSARWFTDRASSLAMAPRVTLRSAAGKALRTLATTDTTQVVALGLQPPELLTLQTADGQPMHGMLYRPADFDSTRKYPVIVSVYGGPHTKAVHDSWETVGFSAAMTQLGFLVAEFDARGTLGRGKAFQAGNYLKMGQVDVDDQAAAMKQLEARSYVDASRVGVTGISHGGYMTLMMMLRYPDVYQVGAAGAPLTDLRNGPRQYIGRFMRTPAANPDGYEKANVLTYADRLQGRLLIYHGTRDQNAVIGNTMQLVRKLVDLGKPIDLMIYPEGVHVPEGLDAPHSLRTIVSYFLEHLRPDGWEASRAAIW